MYLKLVLRACLTAAALLLAACTTAGAPQPTAGSAGVHLALVAYSTPQEAYARLIPAFQLTHSGVSVETSFGSSGSQTQAVINGLDADVVALSLASDMTRLVNADLVAPDWNSD